MLNELFFTPLSKKEVITKDEDLHVKSFKGKQVFYKNNPFLSV